MARNIYKIKSNQSQEKNKRIRVGVSKGKMYNCNAGGYRFGGNAMRKCTDGIVSMEQQ